MYILEFHKDFSYIFHFAEHSQLAFSQPYALSPFLFKNSSFSIPSTFSYSTYALIFSLLFELVYKFSNGFFAHTPFT